MEYERYVNCGILNCVIRNIGVLVSEGNNSGKQCN